FRLMAIAIFGPLGRLCTILPPLAFFTGSGATPFSSPHCRSCSTLPPFAYGRRFRAEPRLCSAVAAGGPTLPAATGEEGAAMGLNAPAPGPLAPASPASPPGGTAGGIAGGGAT